MMSKPAGAVIVTVALAAAACATSSANGALHGVPPRPKPRAGLPYSTASNDVVQQQPAAGSCHALGSGLYARPDPSCTPGALDPAVSQRTIHRTICVSGWTTSVRPPESVTEQEKAASMAAYGDMGSLHAYEYDHFVPLELGGATNDPHNLWPEPGPSPNPKDEVEDELRLRVCDGRLSLVRAQREIVENWPSLLTRTTRNPFTRTTHEPSTMRKYDPEQST